MVDWQGVAPWFHLYSPKERHDVHVIAQTFHHGICRNIFNFGYVCQDNQEIEGEEEVDDILCNPSGI